MKTSLDGAVRKCHEEIAQIATAVEEQSQVSEDTAKSIEKMSEISRGLKSMAQERWVNFWTV